MKVKYEAANVILELSESEFSTVRQLVGEFLKESEAEPFDDSSEGRLLKAIYGDVPQIRKMVKAMSDTYWQRYRPKKPRKPKANV